MASSTVDYMMKRFLTKPKLSELLDEEKEMAVCDLLRVSRSGAETHLRIFDQAPEDHLILLHYLQPDPSVYRVRGLIVDTGIIKIVCMSFPFTEEMTPDDINESECPIKGDIKDYVVTYAHEGTILRLFMGRTTKKWYLSTHRRIDGRNSRWAGPTFGEIFDEFWKSPETIGEGLNPDFCYMFLISHPENRLVCKITSPRIFYLGYLTADMKDTNSLVYRIVITEYLKEQVRPERALEMHDPLNVKTLSELKEAADSLMWEEHAGILLVSFDFEGESLCYKIVHEEYSKRRDLRGSEPNFRLRYLQLRGAGEEKEFRDLFPEKKDLFDQVDHDLEVNLPRRLKKLYHQRYVEKQFETLPPEEHYALEKTRREHARGASILENLKTTLKGFNPRQLNALIKHMRSEINSEELSIS